MEEHWVTTKEDPNYEVSNLGHVRNRKTRRVLKPQEVGNESRRCRVRLSNGKRYYVHRLVANAFFSCDDINEVDVVHLDGDGRNNAIWNLECGSRKNTVRRTWDRRGYYRPDKSGKFRDMVEVVRCRDCEHWNTKTYCVSKPGDFYCAEGRKRC